MLKNKLKIILPVLFVLFCFILLSMNFKPVRLGHQIIFVEVADSIGERAHGLKGRKSLAECSGMLFCFEAECYPQFWMKDTVIPLDIAFINKDKKIVNIQHMTALDDKSHYMPNDKVKYALEMNLGWFDRHEINIGDMVFF